MNKRLYIRLFKDKNDGIPFDSLEIAPWSLLATREANNLIRKYYVETTTDWLLNNPEGKVDFVLL